MKDYVVILFYKFIDIADPAGFVAVHKVKGAELGITGRMLVAEEGINGTFEGERSAIEQYIAFLRTDERFADMPIKESAGTGTAFTKLKIKVRPEVVTLGAGRFNVKEETAPELSVNDLQKWYEQNEDFVVLDLRNDFEIASGKFEKTIDPKLANFRDLPAKLKEKDMEELKNKKVVTVCTGGIRCEKATCLLKREGFTDVYQLKDGIHTYMKEHPNKHFKGTLFVFDNRMTTDVIPLEEKEIIGACSFCEKQTEQYCSDDSVRPSKKILCCEDCFEKHADRLRDSVTTPKVFA
jgi:UPF0176 protein